MEEKKQYDYQCEKINFVLLSSYLMKKAGATQSLQVVISSVESQKGIITIQWCSVESQKGIITIQWCSVENQKGTTSVLMNSMEITPFCFNQTLLNSINAFLVLRHDMLFQMKDICLFSK